MYPVKNPARNTRTRTFPLTAWTMIKLVVVCLLTASVPYALYVRVDSKESRAAVTVQAAERGKPYFNFQDGREMRVDYRGEQNLTAALRTGQAQPRSLASTVLRDAAVPDLIAGYAYNGMGIVTVQHGNPDAFAPKDESVYARMQQGYNPDSLLPGADTYLVPENPDFLQVGDFNHDNRKDVLIAGHAGNLFLLPGDGLGKLNAPEQIFLPGRVTALAAGEFRASDGWTDVAIGVETPAGPALLIYDGDPGLKGEPMSFQLSAPATSVQIAGLDNDPFMDVAVAAGSEVNVIHGWGRKQEVNLESRRERINLNNNARDLAAGFFIWNRAGSNQIAVLSDDGTVSVLDQSGSDSRPFTIKETAQMRLSRRIVQNQQPVDVETVVAWQANNAASWNPAREFSAGSSLASAPGSQSLLQRSHVSFLETDDLLLLNGNQNRVDFVRQIDSSSAAQAQSSSTQGDLTTTSLDASDAPVAVLAMPQKLNGERNLVMLQQGSALPIIVPMAPTATPAVDRFDDPVGGSLAAASVCGVGAGDCSLRGAVQVANASPGSTITLPAGTYVLSSNGTGVGGCDGNTVGDLGVNQGTTINGAGAGSTIIRQTGTGPANNGDRVMCMNEGFLVGISYSFSGFTVHGGRDSGGLGGGGIIGGEQNNSLTLSGVTISNNQVTGGNLGGGGIQITGGNLTITNCLIGGTLNPVLGDRTTIARGNINNTSTAGGLYFSPSAPQHSPSVGNLVVTGTTIDHNHAFGTGGGGATSEINAFGAPGGIGTGTATYDSTTFNANQASNGGGLLVSSLPTTLGSMAGTVSFTSNTATAFGGGVHVGGGSLHINGTLATINFASSNTAGGGGPALGGGSISANGPLTLSGTNTTIGGTAGVFTNGTWTNNAGSAMSPTNFAIVGGTLNCNDSTINVSGNFEIAPEATKGGILNAGSGTINIQGNLNVNLNNGGSGAVGQFNAGTGTFNFNGSAAQSITHSGPAMTFNNLTDSNITQLLTVNSSFGVGGTLNVNGANAIFDPVGAAVISGAGTLTGTGTARVRRLGADTFFNQYTISNKTLTNLTVEYIGAAGQTASTTTYGKLKISNPSGVSLNPGNTIVDGTLTLQSGALAVGVNTLTINNGTTVVGGSLTSGATGTVNYNQGSVGQVVIVANYGNLTFSAFTKVLPSSGTVGIAGTFNPNGVTSGHTITGSTMDFNGTGAQTVPTFNFDNLTISGARTVNSVTLVNGGTIGIAGTFAPTATFTGGNYINTNNTIDFNGTGAQTIPAFNYNNLTISGNRAVAITLGNGNVGVAGTFNPSVTGNTWTPNAANTVVFNGGTLQTIPAFAFFNGLTLNNASSANLGGNVTVLNGLTLTAGALGVGTNTLTLNGAASATAGSLLSAPTGTVNYNQQSDGQATVLAANYGNLTFSNFSKTLASSGTIGILGTFTPGTGTGHTIAGSTINFNGTGSQNIPGFTYNNLTSSGPGVARILDPVNTIKIAGAFTPGTDVYTITGSTVEYNGAAAQTLPATFTTYNNLTLNNPTTVAGFAGLIVQGLLRVQAGTFTSSSSYNNVQIDANATLAATAGSTINVSGNWTNNGTFTPNTGTVVFNGNDNTQTLAGNNTFNNLTVNHTGTGGVTASGSTLAVTGLLQVQGGTFTSSSTFNNVQIDSGGTLVSDGGTMNVSGNWTNNGGTFTPSTGIVNFNGAAAQAINGTVASQTFGNFVVNKSAGALSAGGSTTSITTNNLTMTLGTFTAPATLDINGNTLLTAGTLAAGANITAAGDWTNNGGVFTPGSGTVTFDGGAGQTIGGTTATTFGNLTNGNASGLAMAHDNTVNLILALTSSDITVANTKTLTQPASGSSSGTFDVIGNVKRTGFVTAPPNTLSFGNPNNQITITAGTAPTDINVNLVKSAPAGFSSAVQRTYTITPNGGSGITATLRLHYLDSELNANTEASLNLRRFNGSGWVPYPASNADQVDNWVENNAVHDFSQWTFSSQSPTAAEGSVSGRIVESDGTPVAGAVVRLNGVQDRKFITDAGGYYRFDNVETGGFYTVTPSRANFSFSPAQRSFSQTGNHTEAVFAASSTGGNENPLETPEYFVRQHYLDFLGREPDEAGFNFWSDQILECGTETNCLQRRRENVSAAYFLSIEFQQTGGLVDGLYKASYGVRPQFAEFMPDTRAVARDVVVGRTGWEAKLEANKQAFVDAFVQRPTFVGVYGNMANDAYVDALIRHTGVSFTSAERDPLVSGLADGTLTRSAVLRRIAEEGRFVNAKFNEAFVMMEYFGYLRRNPDASGFQFWLNKLNQFGGNFEQAEMVEAFIVSGEYRDRFAR